MLGRRRVLLTLGPSLLAPKQLAPGQGLGPGWIGAGLRGAGGQGPIRHRNPIHHEPQAAALIAQLNKPVLGGGVIAPERLEGPPLLQLGRYQALQADSGHREHLLPGLHHGLGGRHQQGARLGARARRQGLPVQVGLLELQGLPQINLELAQGLEGVVGMVIKGPGHNAPLANSHGQNRLDLASDQPQLQQPIADEIPQGGTVLGNPLMANPNRQGHCHRSGLGGLAPGQQLDAEPLIVNLQAQPLGKELVPNLAKPLLDQGRDLPHLDRGRHRRGHRTATLNPAMATQSPRPHRCGQAHGHPVGG